MNKTNIELKHFCSDFDKIREVLKEIGAKKETPIKQTDFFFELSRDGARLKLRIEGKKQVLVYYERPDFSKAKGAVAKIKLYNVRDRELLPFLCSALGVKVVVNKKREIWRRANTVFHIDNVKNVGRIFEIELQKKGTITPTDRKQFKAYQDKFLPHLGKVIKGSNADLVISSLK
jgi:predicted adenylyl cyclase CyaB